MNITSTLPASVDSSASLDSSTSPSSANSGAPADDVSLLVLKKAQDVQANAVLGLIQSLPQPAPVLALDGNLGTRINAFA